MSCFRRLSYYFAGTLLVFLPSLPTTAAPSIGQQLQAGQFDAAEQLLADHLQTEPQDDLARFQLGTVKLLRGVEQLMQDGTRYGATTNTTMFPFFRLGGFSNNRENVDPVSYHDLRAMIQRFQDSVAAAEATLAPIEATDLYWPLDFRQVAIDFDGDGQLQDSEQLATLFRLVTRNRSSGEDDLPLVVGFDSADVYWLRGYCHVLQALADMVLAYDHQRLFDLTAHAFFADPQTKFSRARDARGSIPDAGPTRSGVGWKVLQIGSPPFT